jgi:hypothetical protein
LRMVTGAPGGSGVTVGGSQLILFTRGPG